MTVVDSVSRHFPHNSGGTHLEEARRYALIAFDLAKRFGGETWLCRISTQLYGMVNIWVKPMPYCVERLKHAYQVGLGGGDMEYAMVRLTHLGRE